MLTAGPLVASLREPLSLAGPLILPPGLSSCARIHIISLKLRVLHNNEILIVSLFLFEFLQILIPRNHSLRQSSNIYPFLSLERVEDTSGEQYWMLCTIVLGFHWGDINIMLQDFTAELSIWVLVIIPVFFFMKIQQNQNKSKQFAISNNKINFFAILKPKRKFGSPPMIPNG